MKPEASTASHAFRDRALTVDREVPALLLRWAIAPRAAKQAGLVTTEAARPPCLEIELNEGRPPIARILVAPHAREIPIESAAIVRVHRDASGFLHIDLPGLLSATWEERAPGPRVIYARTELLARLGIPGGRYEIERSM